MKSNLGLIGMLGTGMVMSASLASGQNTPPHVNDSWISGNKIDPMSDVFDAYDLDGSVTNIVVYDAPLGFSQEGTANMEWNYEPRGIITNHALAFQAINDRGYFSSTGYLHLDITNRPPHAIPQSIENQEGEDTEIVFSATDPDNDPITYSIVGSVRPKHGEASGSGNTFFYKANRNYFGPDMFQFRAYDGNDSSEAFVDIDVLATDRPFELLSISRNGTNSTIIAKLQPYRNYVLERSDDLTNWTDIGRKEVLFSTKDYTNITYNFSDTNASGNYRVRRED